MTDNVNHPSHYNRGSMEVIDIIEKAMEHIDGADVGYFIGNIMKYLLRHQHKNKVEDLKKARWYLKRRLLAGHPR